MLPALPSTLMADVEECVRKVNKMFDWDKYPPAFHPDVARKLIAGLDEIIPKGLEYMEASRTVFFTVKLGDEFEAYTKNPSCTCPTHKVWVREQAQHGYLSAPSGLGTLIETVRNRYKDMFVVDIHYNPVEDATPQIQRKITDWIVHGKLDSMPIGCRCVSGGAFENSSLVFTIATKPYMNALRTAGHLPVDEMPKEELEDGVMVGVIVGKE